MIEKSLIHIYGVVVFNIRAVVSDLRVGDLRVVVFDLRVGDA